MTTLARAQVRRLEEIAPESAGGGHLIVATVTQHAVTTERVCNIVRIRPGVNALAREGKCIHDKDAA